MPDDQERLRCSEHVPIVDKILCGLGKAAIAAFFHHIVDYSDVLIQRVDTGE